ncbi:MAG: STAS domain-containing protein [Chloroflexota bacterium]
MQKRDLTTQVRLKNDICIIDMEGDISRSSDTVLHAAYNEVSQKGTSQIILNFSDVGFINSTGIAVIVSLLARARAAKQELTVFGLSDHYKRIFEITRLVDFMNVVPDETTALETTT